jgi:hypothetical protein
MSSILQIENNVSNIRLLPKDMPDVLHFGMEIMNLLTRHGRNHPFDVTNPVHDSNIRAAYVNASLRQLCPR